MEKKMEATIIGYRGFRVQGFLLMQWIGFTFLGLTFRVYGCVRQGQWGCKSGSVCWAALRRAQWLGCQEEVLG